MLLYCCAMLSVSSGNNAEAEFTGVFRFVLACGRGRKVVFKFESAQCLQMDGGVSDSPQ